MIPRLAEARDYAAYLALLGFLDPEMPAPSLARWQRDFLPHLFVVDGSAGPIGCLYFDVFDDAAYVYHLVVSPLARRSGAGRALMRALAQHLSSRGVRHWDLNVLPDNVAATQLYASLRMVPTGETTSLRFAWSVVADLPTPESTIVPRELDKARDHQVETRFGLRSGSIDAGRRKFGRRVVSIFESGSPVGVAVFAPALPSTFPFAVTQPEFAGPLLCALQDVADPQLDYTLIAINDDARLVDTLVERGAVAYMKAARYSGSPKDAA